MARLPPKGILDYDHARRHLGISRSLPARDLGDLVECHWEVRWDLPQGMSHLQRNLSHASVSVAWESDGLWIYGVPGKVFEREVAGSGRAFGTKFRPGAAKAILPSLDVGRLTGTRIPLVPLLVPGRSPPIPSIVTETRFEESVRLAEGFWRELRSTRTAPESVALVGAIESDPSLLRVEILAERSGRSVRELQRMFRTEVGIPPKETIRRFRLQQAADRFDRNPETGCLDLAMELGYFDQSHFARDFRAVVGVPPETYRERIRATRLDARSQLVEGP